MTQTTITTAPLTRRQAREIERRTGRRPVAVAPVAEVSEAPANTLHDTAWIERNPELSLVSVFPTEVIGRISAEAPLVHAAAASDEAAAFVRPVSIRAARPAALIARNRRRSAAGVAGAAAAAALATAAIALPAVADDQQAAQAQRAALLTVQPNETQAESQTQPTAEQFAQALDQAAPQAPAVAAPESTSERTQYSVATISADVVAEAVVPEPVYSQDGVTQTDGTGQAQTATSEGAVTSGGTNTSGYTATAATSGGGYSIDVSSIVATAQSYVGTGHGWACDYFVQQVFAQHGISLPRGVSAQAALGTPTSNPQPGDLVVWPGEHIGIYAGNGYVFDNPGDGVRPVQYRAISWGNPYFVSLN